MPGCAVFGFNNYNRITDNIKYFQFPKNENTAKQWVSACQREDKINTKNACICSDHFEPGCFGVPLKHRLLQYCPKNARHLKFDALPTKNIPFFKKCNNQDRKLRLMKRNSYATIKRILEKTEISESNPISFNCTYEEKSETKNQSTQYSMEDFTNE